MNKKIGTMGLVVAGVMGLGSAQAATVSSTLFGGFQQLSDNSAEYLINTGTNGGATTVDVGDTLRGIFTIDTVEQAPSTRSLGGASGNNELTGLFEIVVTSKTSLGLGGYLYTFGPSANFTSVYGAGAMVAFYEDSANNFSRVDVGACNTTSCLEGLATDGSLYWVTGFTDASNFWSATAATDDITVIGSTPAPGNGGGYNTGLNLITNNSGKLLNKVPCGLGGASLVDMCGSGSLLGTGGVSTPFDSFDNVDFAISVPEPTSVMLMGLGLLGMGATAIRRRRKA